MNTWVCATCETEQTGNRVGHFISKHYFTPSEQDAQLVSNEHWNAPKNTVEEKTDMGFFSDSFEIDAKCPECGTMGVMEIMQNLKSIVVKCNNTECNVKLLYRQVLINPPVKGTVTVTEKMTV